MNINRTNYESYFLRYVDKDLSNDEQLMVDNFVAENTDLQIELAYLFNTILVPDTSIVFLNKELLYKKEQTAFSILFFNWQKIAVAAALIVLVFMVWKLLPTKSSEHPIVIKARINKKATDLIATKSTPSTANNKPIINKNFVQMKRPFIHIIATQSNHNTSIAALKKTTTINEHPTNLVVDNNPITIQNKEPIPLRNESIAIQDPTEKNSPSTNIPIPATQISNPIANNTYESTNMTHRTVYKELNTETDNNSIYVGSLELNKAKLRGLFRKATSLLKRNPNQQINSLFNLQNNPSIN